MRLDIQRKVENGMDRKVAAVLAAVCIAAGTLPAAIWTGAGADAKWSNADNWRNGAKPTAGEGISIAANFSGDIELDEDYTMTAGQFILNENTSGTIKEVRLTGDHALTFTYSGNTTLYLYPGRRLVFDGVNIYADSSLGFNVREGSAIEMRSGLYTATGSSMNGYLSGSLTVSGGEFRVRRLARYEGSSVVLSGGLLDYQLDNATVQGTNNFVFTGGTLSTPLVVYWPSFLPVATNQTLIAKNTSSTSVDAMNTDSVFRVSGTLYMTNNYAAGTRQRLRLLYNPVTVGGRGTIYANSVQFSGTAGEYAHFDVAKLRAAMLERGTWGVNLGTHNGIDFGTYGGNITKDGGFNWYYSGMVDVDTTDCFDPEIGRTISLEAFYPRMAPGLRARGKGTFSVGFSNNTAPVGLFTEIGVYEGATMTFSSGNIAMPQVYADVVRLGANATLGWSGKLFVMRSVTRAAEIDPSAVLNVTETGTPSAGYRYDIFDAGPWGDLGGLTINAVSIPEGWRIAKSGGVAYLTDDVTPTIPDDPTAGGWYWVGGGGNWTDVSHWNINKGNTDGTKSPGKNSQVYFAGASDVAITNNTGATISIGLMRLLNGTTALRFRGSPFELTQTFVNSSASAFSVGDYRYSPHVTFETPVSSPNSIVWVTPGRGTLSFLKGFSITGGHFSYCGTVRLGGESELGGLYPYHKDDSQTRTELVLVTGAVVTVTAQATNFTCACNFRIGENAKLKFTGGELVEYARASHSVHGRIDIGVPYSAYGTKSFYGTGRVDVASTKGHASGAGVMEIGEGLRLYLGSWSTVTANAPDSAMTIRVGSAATIGAKADFTYGPAAGVTTSTTAAERALVTEGLYAPLTIDTSDPDTGVGHTITFADPVVAAGDVLVKGAGAVCFASGEDSFAQKLSFDGSAGLSFSAAQRRAALSGWTPVVTAAKIEGMPLVAEGVKVRHCDNGDGTQSLIVRIVGGAMLVIR